MENKSSYKFQKVFAKFTYSFGTVLAILSFILGLVGMVSASLDLFIVKVGYFGWIELGISFFLFLISFVVYKYRF